MHPGWELLLGLYCAFSLAVYLLQQNYLIGPFLLIYTIGFLSMAARGLLEQRGTPDQASPPMPDPTPNPAAPLHVLRGKP